MHQEYTFSNFTMTCEWICECFGRHSEVAVTLCWWSLWDTAFELHDPSFSCYCFSFSGAYTGKLTIKIYLNILGVKFKKLSLQNERTVRIRTNVRVKKASEVKSEVIMMLNSWLTQMNIFHSKYSANSLFASMAPIAGNIDWIMHLKTVTSADTHLIWLTH